MRKSQKKRLIVGISGASGVIYGVRLLELLKSLPDEEKVETHLIMSRAAEVTLAHETSLKVRDVEALADVVHANKDIGASVASGSFRSLGMIIAPCSMKSLAEIATGVTDTLLSRAADVVLKERRRLVCMVRETPLHSGHLRNMLALSDMGAVIAPPVPAFYAKPETIEDMVDHSLGRTLDLFDLDSGTVHRWKDGESR
ncbi:UbiX family flavin prenyltransferase [Nisaea acidiphila]|uniref:Flavin prenyltransferase UbiX n=1 Tax=Nisaea acidiphila TaxID=1862145 RepID=A0A9J7AQ85_9PROT|nr:UbiX family flavin prenyltransferase [Nisaea acidiphila]UUX48761.1 UbiX family flavin prenyltransferase [Nisaea acidiphila]